MEATGNLKRGVTVLPGDIVGDLPLKGRFHGPGASAYAPTPGPEAANSNDVGAGDSERQSATHRQRMIKGGVSVLGLRDNGGQAYAGKAYQNS